MPTPEPTDPARAVDGSLLRDEVDRLAEAWQRERPDLDVSPLQVLSRVTRLARHLDKERSAAFAGSGLESWEFDVLAALRRAGPAHRLSPGQLLKETMVTSGTMTNRVDRLAARGLVTRDPNPDDRRAVLVRADRRRAARRGHRLRRPDGGRAADPGGSGARPPGRH